MELANNVTVMPHFVTLLLMELKLSLLATMTTSWQLKPPLKPQLVKLEKMVIVLIKPLMVFAINVILPLVQIYLLELVLYAKILLMDVQNVVMETLLMQPLVQLAL